MTRKPKNKRNLNSKRPPYAPSAASGATRTSRSRGAKQLAGNDKSSEYILGPKIKSLGLTVLLCFLILAYYIVPTFVSNKTNPIPSTEFQISQNSLSHLPVQIENVRSCGCWEGPRQEAERKYKFTIINHYSKVLDIAGGDDSSVRLIVAYSNGYEPTLTMPSQWDSNQSDAWDLDPPKGAEGYLSTSIGMYRPSRLPQSNKLFAVPNRYTVWAIPPNPNFVFENYGKNDSTDPTYVTTPYLGLDRQYGQDEPGYGDWVFYIPEPSSLLTMVKQKDYQVIPEAMTDKFVIVVGVAAIDRNGGLIGFAPAPTENLLEDPSNF